MERIPRNGEKGSLRRIVKTESFSAVMLYPFSVFSIQVKKFLPGEAVFSSKILFRL
jgi:hypothetical protein